MRSVTRYIWSPPAGDEPVAPAVPLLPIAAEPAPAALGRGIASIDMTTAFGAPAGIPAAPGDIPAAPDACGELPMLPLDPLPMLPLDPLDPLPMLPLESPEPLEPLEPLSMLPPEPLEPVEPLLPVPLPVAPPDPS